MDIAALEQRSADALKAYTDFVTPLINTGAVLTDEQRSTKADLKASATQADENLTEARSMAERSATEAETRNARTAAAEEHRTGVTVDMAVTNEQPVYTRDGRYSYVIDRIFADRNNHSRQQAAQERLNLHAQQMGSILANGGDEARAIEHYVRAENRNAPDNGEHRLSELRKAGVEQRTGITTATGSGGAWVVPVWLLDRSVFYNLPARPFLDALDPIALPPSGMTINIPVQSGPAATAVHTPQNSPIVETDITSNTTALQVQPIMGGLTVSVEQIERESWGGSFDGMLMRSLQQAYNQECDQIAVAAALAGATTLAYNGTFSMTAVSSAGGFYEKVSGAIATINTAAGILREPNALFVSPQRWGLMAAEADANARPLIVPAMQGPQNTVATAPNTGVAQGYVGTMLGLSVYKDLSIPTIGTAPVTDQAVVLDTTAILALEASPTFETFPATLANQGSVYLRLHGYLAVGALQAGAVVSVNGSAMSQPVF
jgi:hypothetical protein